MPVWVHGLLLLSCLMAAAGQIMLSKGATGRTAPLEFVNAWVVGGLAIFGLATMIWIYGLSRGPLTSVYPYTALTFVLVFLSGIFLYGEVVPARALVGAGLVLLGLLLINLR